MPRRAPRTFHRGLDRASVLAAALVLLDAEGRDGLTMRRLARELDIEAPSLYTHVRSKDDLVDGVLDLVLDEVQWQQRPARQWRRELVEGFGAYRRTLLAHPASVGLLTERSTRSPSQVRLVARSLTLLESSGLPIEDAVRAHITLIAYTLGFVAQEVGRSQQVPPELLASDGVFARAIPALLSIPVDDRFTGGLGTILDGIAQR